MPSMERNILKMLKENKTSTNLKENADASGAQDQGGTHVKPEYTDLGAAVVSPTTTVKTDYTKGVPSQALRRMDKAEKSDISGAKDDKGKVTDDAVDEHGDGPSLKKGDKIVAEDTGLLEASKSFLAKFNKDFDKKKDDKKKKLDECVHCNGKGCEKCKNMTEDSGADQENQRQYNKRSEGEPMHNVDGQKGAKDDIKEGEVPDGYNSVPDNLPGGGDKATDSGNLKEEGLDEKLKGLPRLKKGQPKASQHEVGKQPSTQITTVKEDDMHEDIDALFVGESGLSEAFKKKATVIFEAAVNMRVDKIVDQRTAEITEDLTKQMHEAVEEITEELSEKTNQYLNYVSEEWFKENQVSIQSGLRADIAEQFLVGLKGLFEAHFIEIPTNRVDVVAELATKLASIEEQLNTQIENNTVLHEENVNFKKQEVFNEISEGLAESQIDKLRTLSENLEFKNIDTFKQNLSILKESNFSKGPVSDKGNNAGSKQSLTEEKTTTALNVEKPNEMAQYVKAMAKLSEK